MMHIGMILPEFRPVAAGAERMAEALGRALVGRGHEVWVLTGRWRSHDASVEHDGSFHVVRHATLRNGFGHRALWRLGRYVYLISLAWHLIRRGRQWGVWHVHQALTWAAVSVWVARWFRKPVIVKVTAGPLEFDLDRIRSWCRPLILRADRLVCVSELGRRRLLASGVPSEQVLVIPNGVDLDRFIAVNTSPKPVMVYVGRLEWVKGVDVLLEAMAILLRAGRLSDWRLRLVGWGAHSEVLRRQAIALGIAGVIDWDGSRDDVPALLGQCQIFIQPSRSEGMSNSLLEAMACGLACVATDVGGTREVFGYGTPGGAVSVVTETTVGFLVPPESPSALAEAMGQLIDQPQLRRAMGTSARRRMETDFSLERATLAYESLYRQLIDRPS